MAPLFDAGAQEEEAQPVDFDNFRVGELRVRKAEYVSSSVKLEQCPAPVMPEIAVIGRSNVGKSSLINMLTGRKDLALVSKTPGKFSFPCALCVHVLTAVLAAWPAGKGPTLCQCRCREDPVHQSLSD